MINWIKKEYRRFKGSRTVRLSYYQKLSGIVGFVLIILPTTRDLIPPEIYPVLMAAFGFWAKNLRLKTSVGIE